MRKLTIEFIRSEFEKEDYKLLTKNYVNAHQKLRYRCPNGHIHSISWGSWQQGCKCLYCAIDRVADKSRLNIKLIRSEFAKEKYKLLSTEYKNNKQKLKYICPKGHKHSISWNHWQQGYRCPCRSNHMRPTIKFIRSEFAKEKYQLLTTEYKNNKQKLDYICFKGHKHSIRWNDWQQGNRCPCCVGVAKPTIEFIRSEFEKEKYVLLTKVYKNNYQKLNYICPQGHQYSITWNMWQQGQRCPECIGIISKGEIEVKSFIKFLGVKVLANVRSQIFNPETGYGLELDIFMSTLNKAIEYNGEYWHQDKSKDLLKQKLCKSKGIDLLTIWDKEWFNNNEGCKEKIVKFIFDV